MLTKATFTKATFTKATFTIALMATSQAALAQLIPGAGEQLQQIPPMPTPERTAPDIPIAHREPAPATDDSGATIRVTTLHITGQTLYSEATLLGVARLPLGQDVSLGSLHQAANRISDYYSAHGHFLAHAYVPQQDIAGGSVTISVIEGRYGRIDVHNRSRLAPPQARRILSGLDSGDIVSSAPLERRLLLLSDTPGVRVHSTLAPGGVVGTSDLIVDIAPAPRITGSVEADNAGNRYTGTYRLGGVVNLNNPAGIGDVLSVRVLASTGHLGYGRIAYQAPIGNLTVGVAYTHLHYALGREFKSLDADGNADIGSLFASYPLIRSRTLNLNALAAVDVKLLDDNIRLTDVRSRRIDSIATIGFAGDAHDRHGSTSFSIGWSTGNLHFRDPAERAADLLAARTGGGFNKLQGSLARLQTVTGPLSLYVAARGQVAFDNLDSSEKMELGGAYGVRAYPEGEAYGDTGYIATAEARLALRRWTSALPGQFQLIGFVDTGEVRYAQHPWFPGSNHTRRSGFGGGLNWAGPYGLSAQVSYARRIGDEAVTSGPDKAGRAWFQITKQF